MLQSYLLCPVPQWRESNFYRVCGAVSLPRRVRLFCETVRICSASFRQRRTPARRRRRRRRRRTASTPCGSSRSAERRCDSPPCPHPGRGRGASHAPTAPLEAAPSPSLLAPYPDTLGEDRGETGPASAPTVGPPRVIRAPRVAAPPCCRRETPPGLGRVRVRPTRGGSMADALECGQSAGGWNPSQCRDCAARNPP